MNLLVENWRQQEEVFITNLTIIRNRPTKTSVHDLRVSVKKIRSYLRLSEKISGRAWKQSFSRIRMLYKATGKVSDLDASFTLLNKKQENEPLLCNFKEYLSVNRALARKWIKQNATTFREVELDALEQYFKLGLTNAEITRKIIGYSRANIKTVKKLSDHFEKNLHKIRKLLKDVYNWCRIGVQGQVDEFINITVLDKMLTHLGNWQDDAVLLEKTKRYKKELVINEEEKAILGSIQKELANNQQKELNQALKKWKSVER